MNYLILILALIFCVELSQPIHTRAEHSWDLIIFTQSWPPTVCKIWSDNKPSHTCNLPSPEHWSIHGIWPTKLGTKGPAFCNKTWLFDPEQVKPIEDDLEKLWINVEEGTSTYSFWAHEWNKHGTCAAQIPHFDAEIKYFSQGLDWIGNYTMSTILKESGVVPMDSEEYQLKDFYDAIKKKLGVEPSIECDRSKGKQYIKELRICFRKDLTLTDCNGVVKTERFVDNRTILSDCDPTKGIYYERSVKPPQTTLLHLHRLTTLLQWLTL